MQFRSNIDKLTHNDVTYSHLDSHHSLLSQRAPILQADDIKLSMNRKSRSQDPWLQRSVTWQHLVLEVRTVSLTIASWHSHRGDVPSLHLSRWWEEQIVGQSEERIDSKAISIILKSCEDSLSIESRGNYRYSSSFFLQSTMFSHSDLSISSHCTCRNENMHRTRMKQMTVLSKIEWFDITFSLFTCSSSPNINGDRRSFP